MALQDNPWQCSCENVWLGEWLRRWMRETLQLHTSGVERGQSIQNIVRTITCTDPDFPGQKRPLVDLDRDVKCVQARAINAAAEMRGRGAALVALAAALGALFVARISS